MNTNDWNISCLADNEELEPTPYELDAMYRKLSKGEPIELGWKCPGRRLPTPTNVADSETKEDSNSEA